MTPTPFQAHKARWMGCKRCPLHKGRDKVVIYRGDIPCRILFVGEAPGTSEDSLGVPFKGVAGHILDSIIEDALSISERPRPRMGFANMVACIPLDDDGAKTHKPRHECIIECAPRLRELIGIAKPEWIVCVGDVAEAYLMGEKHQITDFPRSRMTHITHPAAITYMNIIAQGNAKQKCSVRIAEVLREL